jgi:iron complex outermembrane receptor protein
LKINSTRQRLLASSMICGATLLAGQAYAAAAADAPATVTEIVVTGTRIPSPNLTSVSPVTTVGSADIKAQGVTRVEDLVNSLPQAFAAQGSSVANGSNGTATVNLRGLGSNRTVVLIDGRRLQAGNPTSSITAVAADLNFIPTALVDRVDILTGGASAVYGADAVAGVVNFIMKHNFEGVRLDAQYSTYQHQQHADDFQKIVRTKSAAAAIPSNYQVPGDQFDGKATEVTLTFGVNAPDGKGNITAYGNYRSVSPVLASERDYTACSANSNAVYFTCGGSGTAYPATFGSKYIVDPNGPGDTFRPATAADVYNFAPTNYLQRPDTRYGLGAFAHYEVTPWAEAYADLMFMEDTSTAQIAPGGVFFGSGPGPGGQYQINCNNPLLSASEATTLCGANAGTSFIQNIDIARRNVEGGGRTSAFRHTEYRYVVGVKGDLTPDWKYDAFVQLGSTSTSQQNGGYFLKPNVNKSLLVGLDSSGKPQCYSNLDGTDSACVPYNIFKIGGVTPAALKYLTAPAFSAGNITERVANFSLVGQLPEGIKSPWSQERIGVALGTEYRREHLDFGADYAQSAGFLNGGGGASPPVNGGYDVYELFSEARVPLVQDVQFIKNLNLELAYRYSDYSNAGATNTYKVAGDWTIVDGLRVRVGYNRAVRAPNVVELFSPQNVVLDGTIDPCAGLKAGDPLVAKCASLFNLTQGQVLALVPDPANQYYGQTGGNPNLKPETADTWTAGVVLQPSMIPGLNVTVDYFDIDVVDYINNIGANLILTNCLNGLQTSFCSLVHRDAVGSLRSIGGFVADTTFNTGGLHTSGVDVSAAYKTSLDTFGIQNMGGIQINFNGTYLDKLETTPQKGDKPIDCAGYYGSICATLGGTQTPNPKWRHKARMTWNTPFPYDLALSAQWRFFSDVDLDKTSNDPRLQTTPAKLLAQHTDLHLGSRSYLDLLASFTIKENYSFRVGVNNVLDKDPPLNGNVNCPTGGCNQNIWPGVYDGLGRYLFVGLTANF